MAEGNGMTPESWLDTPDRGDGRVYVMSEPITFAVDVALATGRPLLLRGKPGSGKSSLAPHIAMQRGWRYYEHVVTNRTQPRDLLWTYDSLRRLHDAQRPARDGHKLDDWAYVRPEALWWALAPQSARRLGRPAAGGGQGTAREPFAEVNANRAPDCAVVLIDEIDKADPDVPNSLLVPLGSHRFTIAETGTEIRTEEPRAGADQRLSRHLIVITTNEERELPQAFLRRCVVAVLPEHDQETLVRIAREHMEHWPGGVSARDLGLAEAVAAELAIVRQRAEAQDLRSPSTAEYLDALRACRTLGVHPHADTQQWRWLVNNVFIKPQQVAEGLM
ncbi:AAA family ATPase [Streptomyces sp. NPDC002574]|uniref:AAA family ATPase n=1 Tax=Streptomyces sp. NPDC002574 TaxID=3364652 RepID=UPI0036CA5B30